MTSDKDIIGEVKNPVMPSGYQGLEGLSLFISNAIKLLAVVAGIWALVNFVLAGLQFISSQGDPKGVSQAWSKIWMALIGLLVIATAFALTGLLSYLLFGDVNFLLTPKVYGPGT